MNFDIYFPVNGKPGTQANSTLWQDIKNNILYQESVAKTVQAIRAGQKELKTSLPAICWVGHSTTGKRLAADMQPTQFVMIDIDHVSNIADALLKLKERVNAHEILSKTVFIIHTTPNYGIRMVFRATLPELTTLKAQMEWCRDELQLQEFGDFDTAVKDLSRISFLTTIDDIAYLNEKVLEEKFDTDPISQGATTAEHAPTEQQLFEDDIEFTEEEVKKFETIDYRGTPLKIIIDKYVEHFGSPSSGEIHNYYNGMVKDFRCICNNDKRALLYLLPRFGHTKQECWSQIVSITRVNTLSRLERNFYFFLKDNGFYKPRGQKDNALEEYMLSEVEEKKDLPPYLPPVFKELVSIAPYDFIPSCINALLPILGTLTSYLQAIYPYDNRYHTTSFFSVIYAPPGTGKGFVERYLDLLFEDLKLRDLVQSERDRIYNKVISQKGQNEKSPDSPHTSLRIIPPKNSEAEFLEKQRDNHGYHMFTYAAEMDSWAKGSKAAGGNKDDMIRIAWDNGEYGQQFKASNTFKGIVRLYWNVLITGTIAQLEAYFKNVENGLVTRCCFTSIENQEFAEPPVWKKLNKKALERIRKFMTRCDERTYETPCTIVPDEMFQVSDDDFDKEVNWRFKFKKRQDVDMSWIMPTINKFHKEQTKLAALDIDRARDVFRRRVGVRGFRLALLCYGLWENPKPSDLQKCIPFIEWWMKKDIENMLKLWGNKYNVLAETSPVTSQREVFSELKQEFTKNDVYEICLKQGIKTPVRRIIFEWKKVGSIEKISKDTYRKKS